MTDDELLKQIIRITGLSDEDVRCLSEKKPEGPAMLIQCLRTGKWRWCGFQGESPPGGAAAKQVYHFFF